MAGKDAARDRRADPRGAERHGDDLGVQSDGPCLDGPGGRHGRTRHVGTGAAADDDVPQGRRRIPRRTRQGRERKAVLPDAAAPRRRGLPGSLHDPGNGQRSGRGPAVGAGGDEQSLRVPPAGRHRRRVGRAETGRGQTGGAAQGGLALLHGPQQNAGDVIRFTVSGLKALKAPDSGLAPRQGGSHPGAGRASSGIPGAAKIAGAVGAGAILTVGTAIILFKSPKTAGAKA